MSSGKKKVKKIVNIDARLENADWPKRTDDTFSGIENRIRMERERAARRREEEERERMEWEVDRLRKIEELKRRQDEEGVEEEEE